MFLRTETFRQFIKYYPIISTIITIHLVLFLMMQLPFFSQNWILETFAGVNLLIKDGEYWRLVTPIFLHLGFAHVLFNSFSLVLFGPALERALGKVTFILFYLACGIGANIATLLLMPLYYTHVGASGAIFGLFGIYLAILLFKKHAMPQQGKQVILPITAIAVVMTFIQPGINITAHIFGLICGLLIGKLLIQYKHIHFS